MNRHRARGTHERRTCPEPIRRRSKRRTARPDGRGPLRSRNHGVGYQSRQRDRVATPGSPFQLREEELDDLLPNGRQRQRNDFRRPQSIRIGIGELLSGGSVNTGQSQQQRGGADQRPKRACHSLIDLREPSERLTSAVTTIEHHDRVAIEAVICGTLHAACHWQTPRSTPDLATWSRYVVQIPSYWFPLFRSLGETTCNRFWAPSQEPTALRRRER